MIINGRSGKLVRDNIIDIIESHGEKPNYTVLTEEQFKDAVREKMVEESQELLAVQERGEVLKEYVDLLAVSKSLEYAYRFSPEEIETAFEAKNKERGVFNKRLFLFTE